MRKNILLGMFDPSGFGLEIGPSYNPLLPKKNGFNVETYDYTSADNLREKYASTPNVDVSMIEPVDYVSDGKLLTSVIRTRKCYDFIIASHVIEHAPDFVGFLTSCSELLKDAGVLVLAVPDKRTGFDVLQSLTSTGQVLQAFLEKRERLQPGQIFDAVAYDALRNGAIGWDLSDQSNLSYANDLNTAKTLFDLARQNAQYIDVHAWRFCPSSFRLIINDLFEIGAINLKEVAFHDSIGNEFFISLGKKGRGCPIDRLTLAKLSIQELSSINTN